TQRFGLGHGQLPLTICRRGVNPIAVRRPLASTSSSSQCASKAGLACRDENDDVLGGSDDLLQHPTVLSVNGTPLTCPDFLATARRKSQNTSNVASSLRRGERPG